MLLFLIKAQYLLQYTCVGPSPNRQLSVGFNHPDPDPAVTFSGCQCCWLFCFGQRVKRGRKMLFNYSSKSMTSGNVAWVGFSSQEPGSRDPESGSAGLSACQEQAPWKSRWRIGHSCSLLFKFKFYK